jgi:hypothetical protein
VQLKNYHFILYFLCLTSFLPGVSSLGLFVGKNLAEIPWILIGPMIFGAIYVLLLRPDSDWIGKHHREQTSYPLVTSHLSFPAPCKRSPNPYVCFSALLEQYGIFLGVEFASYGLGYFLSMIFPVGSAHVIGVVVVFAFSICSGISPKLRVVRETLGVLQAFWDISFPLYAVEASVVAEAKYWTTPGTVRDSLLLLCSSPFLFILLIFFLPSPGFCCFYSEICNRIWIPTQRLLVGSSSNGDHWSVLQNPSWQVFLLRYHYFLYFFSLLTPLLTCNPLFAGILFWLTTNPKPGKKIRQMQSVLTTWLVGLLFLSSVPSSVDAVNYPENGVCNICSNVLFPICDCPLGFYCSNETRPMCDRCPVG